MRNAALSVLLVLFTALSFDAQGQRTCGTDAYFQKSLLADPGLLQKSIDARNVSEKWLKTHPDAKAKKTGAIITIPVVVHVIYENETENISDAQVISQIEVLNDDFRKLNADTGNVPTWFKEVAADVEVVFCLALRDPDGNPTNGITRTSTTVTSFGSANPKSSASGGKDGWPNADYLNFWVCDLGGGLLGYATFPNSGPASEDGVVCGYQYIGKPPDNPFSGAFNEGRTATHEVGHYLGLWHTFQDGCAGMSSGTCGTSGDRICDTPPTQNPNYSCPSLTQNTCSESPVNQNDMHMNYMDYVDDECMNMFSDDQKARMRSVLNTSRFSLQSSAGCMPLSALDASVALVVPTDTVCGSDQFAPVLTLYNYGSTNLTSTTINYQVDAFAPLSYAWTGNLAAFESEEVLLPMIPASLGAHTFKAWTSAPNGGIDELIDNDSTNSSFIFMNGNSVSLTLDYDTFQVAHLVTWDIRDQFGVAVDSGGGYSQNTTTLKSICLDTGCYTFNLYDMVNNGEGSFMLVDVAGDTILIEDDIFSYSLNFCVDLPPPSVSINEISSAEHLVAIYPNPSTGSVRISSELLNTRVETIFVQNTIGQIVSSQNHPEITAGVAELDLASLPGGVYFITIQTSDLSVTRKVSLIK